MNITEKINNYLNESMIDKLEKFHGKTIKPGRNVIKGYPVEIPDSPEGEISMTAVDMDATKNLAKELRKAGFKTKIIKPKTIVLM